MPHWQTTFNVQRPKLVLGVCPTRTASMQQQQLEWSKDGGEVSALLSRKKEEIQAFLSVREVDAQHAMAFCVAQSLTLPFFNHSLAHFSITHDPLPRHHSLQPPSLSFSNLPCTRPHLAWPSPGPPKNVFCFAFSHHSELNITHRRHHDKDITQTTKSTFTTQQHEQLESLQTVHCSPTVKRQPIVDQKLISLYKHYKLYTEDALYMHLTRNTDISGNTCHKGLGI